LTRAPSTERRGLGAPGGRDSSTPRWSFSTVAATLRACGTGLGAPPVERAATPPSARTVSLAG